MKYNAPILGVNFGRIGFLSEIDPSGLEDGLNRLIRGEYTLDERTMLNCTVNGGEPHYFLNDVLLYKRTFSGVVEISIDVDGLSAGSVICDGVIASTSTGSTGYSISAGGPVIAPGLDALIITPICPHTLTSRPIVAPAGVKASFSMKTEGCLSVDGIYTSNISTVDTITVSEVGAEVGFVRFGRQNIYELIRQRLS
jgi:NAD+ kinase